MKKHNKYTDRWKSDAFENNEIAQKIYLDVKKKLTYSPHPISGWRSDPDQNLTTIKINKNGLRNKNLNLLDNSIENCMLLGGSVAWGFGASSNEKIISSQIEKKLEEQFNKKINIINFAEQMHCSHEELMTFVGYIDEINPQYVICFSGTNDINRGYNNSFKFTDLNTSWINFFNKCNAFGIVRENNILKFLLKSALRYKKTYKKISSENLIFKNPSKDDIPLKLYKNKIEIINAICIAKKVFVLHVLQPDLVLKKKKKSTENDYFNFLEKSRIDYVIKHIKIFRNYLKENQSFEKSSFIKYLDLTEVFDEIDDVIYIDKAHLNDRGNEIIAQKISNEIHQQFF